MSYQPYQPTFLNRWIHAIYSDYYKKVFVEYDVGWMLAKFSGRRILNFKETSQKDGVKRYTLKMCMF